MNRVMEPLKAIVALLFDIGWSPLAPDQWQDEAGILWPSTGVGTLPMEFKEPEKEHDEGGMAESFPAR